MIVSNSLPASGGRSRKHTNHSDDRYSSSLDSNVSRFGCWNVRTMSGREEELVDEMKRYGLKVLGVSETKMRGNGMKRIGDATCAYIQGCKKVDLRQVWRSCCQRSLVRF